MAAQTEANPTERVPTQEEERVPTQKEVMDTWLDQLKKGPVYKKVTEMLAMRATADGHLETIVNGKTETTKAYKKGDYIIQGTEKERYTIAGDKFDERYELSSARPAEDEALAAEGFKIYTPTGRAFAMEATKEILESFPWKFPGKFIAPWGSEMVLEEGDWITAPYPDAQEVYRIEKNAFSNTYAVEYC